MNGKRTTVFRMEKNRLGRLIVIVLLLAITAGCDYARMREDEAVQTYKGEFPQMPKKSIPVHGGIQVLRESNPSDLKNPLQPTAEVLARGGTTYKYYCIQCHGPKANGFGTVGQSFSPLPANLVAPAVLSQTDGELFYKISLGFNRHPQLYETVAERDRWAIILYLRSTASGRT